MANGFRDTFRLILQRYLGDLEKIRGNVAFGKLTGEVTDMAREATNVRFMAEQANEPGAGGTSIERWLMKAQPGFFKMVGLTPWTMFWKNLALFSAQHTVMKIAQKVVAGTATQKEIARLAALNINVRDMKLLGSMKVNINDGGKLILPAVDDWTGVDGQRARELLLTAIHGEVRRVIVTPSLGDRSLMFSGVWEQGGKKLGESDLMTLPLQFLSYGVAAHNKILVSGLQGRDANMVGGMLMMVMAGMYASYLKTPENAWRNKNLADKLVEGYENSGVGGFWFGDVNQTLERMSGHQFGIRPALGLDPRFGKADGPADRLDVTGPAISTIYDLSRAFWDSEISATNRAQLIRRAVIYNNVLWWSGFGRNVATDVGETFE